MDDQQEQKPKKGAVDRINDLANRGKSAYKWGQRARHPIQTFNAAKQNAAKLGNTVRHPISAARTAMGIGQATQGASGAASAGSGAIGGTAGGTGIAGTGAATTVASGATGAASATATGAQAVTASATTALGTGLFATAAVFVVIFFIAFIILFPGFAGTGEGAPIPPGGGGNGGGAQINLSCNIKPAGPPSGNGSDCPIRGGTVTLGSFCAQKAGDGHCTPKYLASFPENTGICANSNTGTQFGLDIGAPNGTTIILPRINGKVISYSLYRPEEDTGNGFIQYYNGIDSSTGTLYRLQLHHTSSGSGKSGSSGDRGGVIGAFGHVHVQLALRKATGLEWVDAPLWFCN